MRDTKRLFIGGLFKGATDNDLRERFQSFGKVEDIDIRVKKDSEGEVVKTFAYINLKTEERSFNKCLSVLNKCKWKGNELHLEIAKESFLTRLKKEQFAAKEEEKPNDKSVIKEKVKLDKNTLQGQIVPKVTKPDQTRWVRGRAGKLVPVLNIKEPKSNKIFKHDPTKNPHNIKKLDIGRSGKQIATCVSNLTWSIAEDITQHSTYTLGHVDSGTSDDSDIDETTNKPPVATSHNYIESNIQPFNTGNNSQDKHTADLCSNKVTCISSESETEIKDSNSVKTTSTLTPSHYSVDRLSGQSIGQNVINIDDTDSDVNIVGVTSGPLKLNFPDNRNIDKGPPGIHKKGDTAIIVEDSSEPESERKLSGSGIHQVKTLNSINRKHIAGSNALEALEVISFVDDIDDLNFKNTSFTPQIDYHSSSDSDLSVEEISKPATKENLQNTSEMAKTGLKRKKGMKSNRDDPQFHPDRKGQEKVLEENNSIELRNDNSSDSESDVPDIESWLGKNKSSNVLQPTQSKKQRQTIQDVEDSESPQEKLKNKKEQKSVKTQEELSRAASQTKAYTSDEDFSDDNFVGGKYFKSIYNSKKYPTPKRTKEDINVASANVFQGHSAVQGSTNVKMQLSNNKTGNYSEEEDILDVIASGKWDVIKKLEKQLPEISDVHSVGRISKVGSKDSDRNKINIQSGKSVQSPIIKNKDNTFSADHAQKNLDSGSDESDDESTGTSDTEDSDTIQKVDIQAFKNRSSTDSSVIKVSKKTNADEISTGVETTVTSNRTNYSSSEEEDLLDSIAAGKWEKVKKLEKHAKNLKKQTKYGNIMDDKDTKKLDVEVKKSDTKSQKKVDKELCPEFKKMKSKTDETVDQAVSDAEKTNVKNKVVQKENVEKHEASNKKRLESIKEKAKQVKEQKSLIQKALASVDSAQKNKKIVFDSDSDDETPSPKKAKENNCKLDSKPNIEKPSLFEDDDSNESDGETSKDDTRFNIKPQFEGKHGTKLLELQSKFINDQRFRLDARFAESDSDSDDKEEICKEKSEKQKSLEVLEKVMGKKVGTFAADKKKKTFKDVNALSYDPSKEGHENFEIQPKEKESKKESKKTKDKKEKSKENEPAINTEPVVEVSKEKFYQVTDNIKDLFQKTKTERNDDADDEEDESVQMVDTSSQPFSLLKMFGSNDDEIKTLQKENVAATWKPITPTSIPGKMDYKDSDDEKLNENASDDRNEEKSSFYQIPETFFFTVDDPRIQEGLDFFHRSRPLEHIRREWLQRRPDLVDAYKLKRKRALRKKRDLQKHQSKFNKRKKFLQKKLRH